MRITWAKRVTKNRAKITCTPIIGNSMQNNSSLNSSIHISTLHKTIQDRCVNQLPRKTTKTNMLQKQELCNTSFQDNTIREVRQNDFDIPDIILTRTNDRIWIHCTKNITIILNKLQKKCFTKIPIMINNITDYELQGEHSSKRIYSHTITESWNKQLDNVMKSETDNQGQPDLITIPAKETSLNIIDNLFTYQDGRLHPLKMSISGIIIITAIMSIACLICYCKRNPKICNNIFKACHDICSKKNQTKKSILIDNVLNSIKQELQISNLEPTQLELASIQGNSSIGRPPSTLC